MIHREPSVYVLAGACSTGKTSLLDHYKDNPTITTVEEAAREFYIHHDVPTEDRGSLANQQMMQDFYIAKYEEARATGKDILCDSSPLSSVAYASLKSEAVGQMLLDRIQDSWMPQVTRFLVLDTDDIPYVFDLTDPVRKETPEQRMAVQAILLDVLAKTNAPATLISGNLSQRIAKIDAILADK